MRPVVEVQMHALSLGMGEPSTEPVVLAASPQRAMFVERLIISSFYAERWEVILLGKNGESLLAGAPYDARMFGYGSFAKFRLQVEPGELLQLVLRWRGPLPRFPVYLPPRLAWRPKYRGAWWVTRKPVQTAEVRAVVLGAVR